MARLSLKGVSKVYPSGVAAVTDFSLDIRDGDFVVLVGPSGCGKSTVLRMIAGLEEITSGELYIDGKKVNDVDTKDRDVAMLSQGYTLYPHLTVYDNMAFGLKLRKVSKQDIDRRVREAAAVLGLTDCLMRKPKTLSGGQRQRVALGRALVREPKVFLLDEPLSNLDGRLRAQMRTEIAKLHARLGTTFLYVTNDQVEAMTMGTRVVVMREGFMQQADTPQNLYDYPINQFVAGLIGSPQMNFFEARLARIRERVCVEFSGKRIALPRSVEMRIRNPETYIETDKPLTLGIRPEDIHDEESFLAASPDTVIEALVEVVEKLGSDTHLCCRLDTKGEESPSIRSSDMIVRVDPRSNVGRGEVVELAVDARHIHLFDVETELSLLSHDEDYELVPENEKAAAFVPLTPQEMRAKLGKDTPAREGRFGRRARPARSDGADA